MHKIKQWMCIKIYTGAIVLTDITIRVEITRFKKKQTQWFLLDLGFLGVKPGFFYKSQT